MTPTITDLRQKPEFFDAVADRIWRAWWEPKGVPLAYISDLLRENLTAGLMPRAFVAHVGAVFAGSASVIASDVGERPQYTPWVAAVWTEPRFRSRQIGRRLVAHAAQYAFDAGLPRIYLAARPLRRSFYEGLGWTPIEEDVGDARLIVFAREASQGASVTPSAPPQLP